MKEIHNVYASPGAIDAYRKTGHFPEGAVLVKEGFHTATQQMTPGTVSHAEKLVGWFVMVKESKNIHPDNKLWVTAGPGPISTAPIRKRRHPQISK